MSSTLPAFIDSHCHLEADDFRSKDGLDERPAVVQRARAAGVQRLIVIGSGRGRAEIDNALYYAHSDPDIVAAIGVHPHEAGGMTESLWGELAHLVTDPRVVAVGETGL